MRSSRRRSRRSGGRCAQTLVHRPDDVYAPLATLARCNGYVLLIAVGLDKLTLLHLAEKEAGRQLFRRWANYPEGHPTAVEVGGCSGGFRKHEAHLQELTQILTVGQSVWMLLSARMALRAAGAAMRANPAITHCGNPSCGRWADAVASGPIL
jgi:aminoglycoside N3'-acetyltransferase